MPVPSSYNDVTQDKRLRDFLGWVWYQRTFHVPESWKREKRRIFLRFDSVNYYSVVYLNNKNIMNHTGGHLPFQIEVTSELLYFKNNLLSVAVNNTLTGDTIPQGGVKYFDGKKNYPNGYYEVSLNFDFFNYAGIHRSVRLYSLPPIHIFDVAVVTGISSDETTGIIDYSYVYDDSSKSLVNVDNVSCRIEVFEKDHSDDDSPVASASGPCSGTLLIQDAKFWWPINSDDHVTYGPGYLYTAKFMLINSDGDDVLDIYYQKIGIRTIEVTNSSFLINKRPVYFMGFGKHEDSNVSTDVTCERSNDIQYLQIRGRGLDLPLLIKDVNLIKWIGANSFRTSHYPYSEELMDMTDAEGIMVINECPAVGLRGFDSSELLQNHQNSIQELIQRDKNRPSTVMWSIANEPDSSNSKAEEYFRQIVQLTKSLDNTRPLSAAINADVRTDHLAQFCDVLMINRYYSWYSNTGGLETIKDLLVPDLTEWHEKYSKPVMMSEYGADTIAGLHSVSMYCMMLTKYKLIFRVPHSFLRRITRQNCC